MTTFAAACLTSGNLDSPVQARAGSPDFGALFIGALTPIIPLQLGLLLGASAFLPQALGAMLSASGLILRRRRDRVFGAPVYWDWALARTPGSL